MTTLPSTKTELTAAKPDEIRTALRPLFAQFPAQDGDGEGKLLGYIIGLEGEPRWAIDRAVRRFIRGEIEEHDGRFLPTSAELAKAARSETEHARKMADYSTRFAGRKRGSPTPRPIAESDYRGTFPTPGVFASWRLPAGTIITAADATVTYPDGGRESWTTIEQRMGRGQDTLDAATPDADSRAA